MDPRLVNCFRVRSGCMPCNNLYSTAQALAKVSNWITDKLIRSMMGTGRSGSTSVAACRRLGFRQVSFGSGASAINGFCLGSIGGTIVFTVPSKNLSVAITVNKLTARRAATMDVIHLLCRHLHLGEPTGL
jgi:hypothetical protein